MMKLTLSVDAHVVARAKQYARARRTSVSRLVETMLHPVATPATRLEGPPPVLARLRGSLKQGSVADYRRHLEPKYR
jgi:hypothetical protein